MPFEETPPSSGETPPGAAAPTPKVKRAPREPLTPMAALESALSERGDWSDLAHWCKADPGALMACASPDGRTALHFVVARGYPGLAEALLAASPPGALAGMQLEMLFSQALDNLWGNWDARFYPGEKTSPQAKRAHLDTALAIGRAAFEAGEQGPFLAQLAPTLAHAGLAERRLEPVGLLLAGLWDAMPPGEGGRLLERYPTLRAIPRLQALSDRDALRAAVGAEDSRAQSRRKNAGECPAETPPAARRL